MVSGAGGMGKTTLARAYPEKFWRLYSGMFWIDCRQDLAAQFARVYDAYFGPAEVLQDENYKASHALHELNQRRLTGAS